MSHKKRLQIQRRHVRLGKQVDDLVFDQSGAPICPTCLAHMHPIRFITAYGTLAPDGKDLETTLTFRCAECHTEVDAVF